MRGLGLLSAGPAKSQGNDEDADDQHSDNRPNHPDGIAALRGPRHASADDQEHHYQAEDYAGEVLW